MKVINSTKGCVNLNSIDEFDPSGASQLGWMEAYTSFILTFKIEWLPK